MALDNVCKLLCTGCVTCRPWCALCNVVLFLFAISAAVCSISISTAGRRHTDVRQATVLQTTFITTSLAGIDTSALTHRVMQWRRSVRHPGRSGNDWGTRVSAFQSCTCSVQRLQQRGRRSRRDHSRQSDIEFDVGLPGAVGVGPAATSSHRFACIYDATRGTALGTGVVADRSSREQKSGPRLCGDR